MIAMWTQIAIWTARSAHALSALCTQTELSCLQRSAHALSALCTQTELSCLQPHKHIATPTNRALSGHTYTSPTICAEGLWQTFVQ